MLIDKVVVFFPNIRFPGMSSEPTFVVIKSQPKFSVLLFPSCLKKPSTQHLMLL